MELDAFKHLIFSDIFKFSRQKMRGWIKSYVISLDQEFNVDIEGSSKEK